MNELTNPQHEQFARLVASDDSGGTLARRMLPVSLLIPPTVAWFRMRGEQAGLYGSPLGLALFASINVVILGAISVWSGASLSRADSDRRRSCPIRRCSSHVIATSARG